MNKVSMDKRYKTRDGNDVRVLCLDRISSDLPVVALIKFPNQEEVTFFKADGKSNIPGGSFDLIEVSPYADFKIDDKVIVWDNYDVNKKRNHYFAGLSKDGKPMTFDFGATYFSAKPSLKSEWDNCELYKEE